MAKEKQIVGTAKEIDELLKGMLSIFGCQGEILDLVRDGTLEIINADTAEMAEYLRLDVVPLRRKERYEDTWDLRVIQVGIQLKEHREKFVVFDESKGNKFPLQHLFSAPDESKLCWYVNKMLAQYRS